MTQISSSSSSSELEDAELKDVLEDATSFFLRREGPASAAAVSADSGSVSGAEARSPDSTRRPVGTTTVAGSELVNSPRNTESIPVTLLEVLKDL